MSSQNDEAPLSSLLSALVDAERQRPGYGQAAEARMRARIESSLDWIDAQPESQEVRPTVLRPVSVSAAGAGSGSVRARRWIAAAVVVATLGVGAGAHAAYQAVARHMARTSIPIVPAPLPEPMVPSVRPPPVEKPVEHEAAVIRSPGPKAVVSGHPSIARERELLEMARAALGLSRLAEARAALDRHRRDFPNGRLTEERESLAVQLWVALGEIDRARASAARFHARYPSSIFWPAMARQIEQPK